PHLTLLTAITRCWSALRSAAVERMGENEVRWRSLGGLFVAGGLLALVMVALPVDPGTNQWPITAIAAAAILQGGVMMAFPRALPTGDRWVSFCLGIGTLFITGGIYFARTSVTPLALLYLWIALDGFFFLSRASALRHLALVGVAYAAVLAALPTSDATAVGRWVMTMGTVCAVGALADVLRE